LKNPQPADGPTRRVNWQDVVQSVAWQPVDSPFEADWVYLETARRIFPERWRELVPWTQTFFARVDPDAQLPRYTITEETSGDLSQIVGPLPRKDLAGRLIELVEDSFDLCRYYQILSQSPRGTACAYKDMGKCPAPCDGSISLEQYRRMVEVSLAALADPEALIAEHTRRMEDAAGELRFETAAKIKALIEQLGHLVRGPLSRARPLTRFRFVSLQAGRGKNQAKAFLVLPGIVEPLAALPCDWGKLAELALRRSESIESREVLPERIGLAARHLFAAEGTGGIFIPLCEVTGKKLAAGMAEILRRRERGTDKLEEPHASADSGDIHE
jgi:hypothetical protein